MGMTDTGISAKELQEYEAVFASVTRGAGGTTYFADSGGRTPTGDVYVLWDVNRGFTGDGWDKETVNSPHYGFTEDQFEEDIKDGNLNDMFGSWSDRVPDINSRLQWLMDLPAGCKENAQ